MTEFKPRDTRRVLLDAAAEEFAKHGLQGTRVEAIVKRSGVNERMIYHHFGSKDGLYRAVLADQWMEMGSVWEHALTRASQLEPRRGLAVAFCAMFERFAARPLMVPLAIHESMSGWKALPEATLAQVPAEIRKLYARGQREGVFRSHCDFETLYLTLMGALTSLTVVAPRFSDMREQGRKDPAYLGRIAERMIDLVLDGASRANSQKSKTRSRK
ncbi:MAG TPA: TetR/AcrR family transcriptional regulator [Polyangiaceae bacterium]